MATTFQTRPAAIGIATNAPVTGMRKLPLFDLRGKADQWHLRKLADGSHEWLPWVKKHTYKKGSQGAHFADRHPATGQKLDREVLINRDKLQLDARRDGWITIPPGPHLVEYDTPTGIGYCLAWESWAPAVPGFKPEREVDESAEVTFLRALVADGTIPIPPRAFHVREVRKAEAAVVHVSNRPPSAKKDQDLHAAEQWAELVRSTPLPSVADFQPAPAPAKKAVKRG